MDDNFTNNQGENEKKDDIFNYRKKNSSVFEEGESMTYDPPKQNVQNEQPFVEEPVNAGSQSQMGGSQSYGAANVTNQVNQQYGAANAANQGAQQYGGPQQAGQSYSQQSYGAGPQYYNQGAYRNNAQPYGAYSPQMTADGKKIGNGFGIASMICGIASLVLFFSGINYLAAIAAIILGILQLAMYDRKVFAIVGISTGGLAIVVSTIFWVFAVTNTVRRGYDYMEDFYYDYEDELDDLYNDIYDGIEDGLDNYYYNDDDSYYYDDDENYYYDNDYDYDSDGSWH